ncbi:TraM recognition domain-containing protein, partial [Stenotrophomonas maltophilia]|uniref:TraM recognition domain-containing protein n=1 Tax=Stenotrophomonas maltophilia TaxID=40324 RepID=UPI0013D90972
DYSQLKLKYSPDHIEIINTTTAVKLILPQNNKGTVEVIVGMVGKTTVRRGAHSYQDGLSKQTLSWSRSDQIEETDFLRAIDIGSIPQGQH